MGRSTRRSTQSPRSMTMNVRYDTLRLCVRSAVSDNQSQLRFYLFDSAVARNHDVARRSINALSLHGVARGYAIATIISRDVIKKAGLRQSFPAVSFKAAEKARGDTILLVSHRPLIITFVESHSSVQKFHITHKSRISLIEKLGAFSIESASVHRIKFCETGYESVHDKLRRGIRVGLFFFLS